MLWENNKELAIALRNQGLADCLTARFALRPVDLKLFGQPMLIDLELSALLMQFQRFVT